MINSFRDEYRFLSNFWFVDVEFEGIVYPSIEHAYVAAKTLDESKRLEISKVRTPGEVKRLGRSLELREDWEDVKLDVMKELVTKKFNNSKLKRQLLATKDQELVEGNTWGDTFWGVCRDKGSNHLGKILMQVRQELKDNKNND